MRLDPYLSAASGYASTGSSSLSFRCPVCGHQGAFETVGLADLYFAPDPRHVGMRMCPRPECRAVVYVVYGAKGEGIVLTEPRLTIDFDATSIPPAITQVFAEALICHSNGCHIAAGIMVRKTLEVLCDHEGVKEGLLSKRLVELRTKVTLPPALLNGLEELRLLGNDAAHVRSRDYEEIGSTEIELAIDLAKEIMKSLYQTQSLLERLQALKRSSLDAA